MCYMKNNFVHISDSLSRQFKKIRDINNLKYSTHIQ